MTIVNGMNVEDLKSYVESIRRDRSVADRNPVVTAHWEGKSRARVEADGRKGFYLGGDDDFSAMQAILGALAACDVEVVATHATLIGLEIHDLRVEATGNFNVASLLGVDSPTDAAYEQMSYKVILDAPGASPEQLEVLRRACEESSPVGDSLRKAIPLRFELETP
ncbi:MAG TPA: OsmC family protein [Actinomycetota bacterium]|nr:OsmC family protein [Actinomycetota bacterium]